MMMMMMYQNQSLHQDENARKKTEIIFKKNRNKFITLNRPVHKKCSQKKQRKKKIGNSENKRWEIGNEKEKSIYHYQFQTHHTIMNLW